MLINNYIKKEENMMGFGDFIRGTISCCQLAKEEDIKFDTDFGHLQKYFKTGPNHISVQSKVLNFRNKGFYPEFKDRLGLYARRDWTYYNKQDVAIFTNTWPRDYTTILNKYEKPIPAEWGEVDPDIKAFIADRLQPSELLLKDYPDPGKDYEILHIRAGDPNAFGKTGPDGEVASLDAITGYLMRILPNIYEQVIARKHALIILSDSITLKEHLESIFKKFRFEHKRLTFSQNDTAHSGSEDCINTIYDLLMLMRAQQIHQTSVYHWGSGFSNIAHHIFDVPLIKYPQII